MKPLLMYDQNISYKLVKKLSDLYPGSTHVKLLGLEASDDRDVWFYAKEHGYTLVSQDSDFLDLAILHGAPPKVIWLRCGNSSTHA